MSASTVVRRQSMSGSSSVPSYYVIPLLDHASPSELPEVSQLHALLETKPASSLLNNSKRPLVTIPSTASISAAVNILAAHRILSAPVIQADSTCVGVIDMQSVVNFISSIHITDSAAPHHDSHSDELRPQNIRKASLDTSGSEQLKDVHSAISAQLKAEQTETQRAIAEHHHAQHHPHQHHGNGDHTQHRLTMSAEQVANEPVSSVVSQSSEYLYPFFEHNPANILLELFATDVHRVSLISDAYELKAPCSQSDMIRLIHECFSGGQFKEMANVQVSALPLQKRELISVNEKCSLRQALQTLTQRHVSTVAIVDETSRALVADISASALRGLADFREVNQNVIAYLRKVKSPSLTPKQVKLTDTLAHVVSLLVEGRSHRVWVLDETKKPIDLLTATDVLRLLGTGTGRTVSAREANGDVNVSKLWKSVDATVTVPGVDELSQDNMSHFIV